MPKKFPFSDDDITARKVVESRMLAFYRDAYTPGPDSPLIGAGDPADGQGSYIGAVGTGANAPDDYFGQHGVK